MIVQDLFRDCDSHKIADELLKLFREEQREKCLKNIDIYYERIENTIEDILSLKPILCEDYVVLSMVYEIDGIFGEYSDISIVKLNDLKNNKDFLVRINEKFDIDEYRENYIESYSLMYLEREILLGHKFCENILSIYDKNFVIAAVLFELTWFGYSNEENKFNLEMETNKLMNGFEDIFEDDFLFDEVDDEPIDFNEESVEPFHYTDEQLNDNIEKNMKPIYAEYCWILKKEGII